MTKKYTHAVLDNHEEMTKKPLDEVSTIGENDLSSLKLKSLEEQEFTSKESSMSKQNRIILVASSLIAIIMGTLTGFGAYQLKTKGQGGSGDGTTIVQNLPEGQVQKGDIFGVKDAGIFGENKAEGYLDKGGVDDEGSHRLLRPGGESQTVYLTSSVTDLDKFVGMNVKVAGETFKAQKAGWLMDVGQLEVLDPKGTPPEGSETEQLEEEIVGEGD